jgi:hypothetical protein
MLADFTYKHGSWLGLIRGLNISNSGPEYISEYEKSAKIILHRITDLVGPTQRLKPYPILVPSDKSKYEKSGFQPESRIFQALHRNTDLDWA